MVEPKYLFGIDDLPPFRLALLYGFQWAILVFPALIIVAGLVGKAVAMELAQQVRFLQILLLVSGAFTAVQTLWGHRFPVLEGPATALLLTSIVLAPHGIDTIQAGMIAGGALLVALVALGRLRLVVNLATPNVVGVILMLISFTLLPHLILSMSGADAGNPAGQPRIFLASVLLVLVMAALSHWLPGFWKSVALLLGIGFGTVGFALGGLVDSTPLTAAAWISLPGRWTTSLPRFHLPGILALGCAYVAVVVNSLGSLHGIAALTDSTRLPSSISRGILVNGLSGICCGVLGVIGTVSYSISPGVVLANRVASRFAVTWCGIILMVAAFVPKLASLLALVPTPVVGAALAPRSVPGWPLSPRGAWPRATTSWWDCRC
jgi:uracil permease